MMKRTLGKTGLQVTQLGYGSMGLRGPRTWGVRVVSDAESDRFLNVVLNSGINLIDTSPDYGAAESRIGRAIAHRRDGFYLATKCGCVYEQKEDHLELDHVWSREVVQGNLETSLRRLRTEYIDLLQFHGGDAESLESAGLIDLLAEFRQQGKIRFVGVSSSLPKLSGLLDLGVFDSVQLPYSCLAPQHDDSMRRAASEGVGVIVRGGIAHGGPDAEIERPHLDAIWEAARLDELRSDGQSRAEFILRYTLAHPNCDTTIVGTCNDAHLAENLAAAEKGPLAADVCEQVAARVSAVLS